MRGTECIKFGATTPLDVDSAVFVLTGGVYVLGLVATFGGGNVVLEMQLADGSSYAPTHTALTAAGITPPLYLPPGSYRLNLTTAVDVVGCLTRVPFE